MSGQLSLLAHDDSNWKSNKKETEKPLKQSRFREAIKWVEHQEFMVGRIYGRGGFEPVVRKREVTVMTLNMYWYGHG